MLTSSLQRGRVPFFFTHLTVTFPVKGTTHTGTGSSII